MINEQQVKPLIEDAKETAFYCYRAIKADSESIKKLGYEKVKEYWIKKYATGLSGLTKEQQQQWWLYLRNELNRLKIMDENKEREMLE